MKSIAIMNIDAIATLVFNFFLLFKRIAVVFNVPFCCFAGCVWSRSHFLPNWWTNSTDDNALAFVSRFVFVTISKCFIMLVAWFNASTEIFKSTRQYDSVYATAMASIKSDLVPNSNADKLVGKERPNAATSSCKAALLKELEAIDLQFSSMDAVIDKISFVVDDMSQSVGKQTIQCVTKPIKQQAASIEEPLKPPIPSTRLPVKQPNSYTGKPLTQPVRKQPIHSTEELIKRPIPSTRKAVKQPNPSFRKVVKQPNPSFRKAVKQPNPSFRKAVKQPNPSTRKPVKNLCPTNTTTKQPLSFTRKPPIPATRKPVKNPYPSTRKLTKQPLLKTTSKIAHVDDSHYIQSVIIPKWKF